VVGIVAEPTTEVRRYVVVLQAREGYPPTGSPLVDRESAPAPPEMVSVVKLDDYEDLERQMDARDERVLDLEAVVRRRTAERDFLLDRSGPYHLDVGLSSAALVKFALTGVPPAHRPMDASDLGRCERTYAAAPEHLKARMHPKLEFWRASLAGGSTGGQTP
jgi:hypothetical protein